MQAGLHERIADDKAFFRGIIPAVRRLLEAFHTFQNPEGLIEHGNSFIEPVQLRGDGVGLALNAIFVRTLDEIARLEQRLGRRSEPRSPSSRRPGCAKP